MTWPTVLKRGGIADVLDAENWIYDPNRRYPHQVYCPAHRDLTDVIEPSTDADLP